MALTPAELIGQIQHTLGLDESQMPEINAFRIINDAGEWLMNMRQWQWAQDTQSTLDFEASTDHVWLPRDYRDMIHVDVTQGLTTGFSLTTAAHLVELRTSSITSSTWRHWGIITYVGRKKRAFGTITFTDVPADTATIVLDDGVSPAVTFEFDTAGDGATTGRIEVDTSASTTEEEAAALFQTAVFKALQGNVDVQGNVAADTGSLEFDATVSGAVVTLTARNAGTISNIAITSSGTINATLIGMIGGQDGGRPEPRIDLWPTPEADSIGALTIYYRRGWNHMDIDTHEVSLPEWMEGLFIQIVRAFARGYMREDVAGMQERLTMVEAGPQMHAAQKRDNQIQPSAGRLLGGAAMLVATHVRQYPFNFTGTTGPGGAA